ncbi:heparinase II/III family protein [Neobacillus niacini]|uniref:heparinase II/III domain-containing protein n=1 Tax=Neobacillus niacini TaxID=86668 RepID=UPI003982FB14
MRKKYKIGLHFILIAVLLLSIVLQVPMSSVIVNAEGEPDVSTKLSIQNFEQLTQWSGGLLSEKTTIREGTQSGRWQIYNSGNYRKVVSTTQIPHDWSGHEALRLWVHSKKATDQRISVILDSNSASTTAADYFIYNLIVDWEGWKELVIPFYMFTKANSPEGFSKIDSLKFHTNWYAGMPDPNPETELIFDDFTIDTLQALDRLPVDGFEDVSKWTSLVTDSTKVKEGRFSGKWMNLDTKSVVRTSAIPTDWSRFDTLQVWLYSEKATGSNITVILESDDTSQTGLDYYSSGFIVDWTGWKKLSIPLKDLAPARNPLGLDQIQRLQFHAKWSAGQVPAPDTVLYFDSLELVRETFTVPSGEIVKQNLPGSSLNYSIEISNKANETDEFQVQIPSELDGIVSVDEAAGTLAPNQRKILTFTVTIPTDASKGEEKQMTIPISSRLQMGANFNVKLAYKVADWQPSMESHPNAFVGADEVERAKNRVQNVEWAKSYWSKVKAEADKWLTSDAAVPREGGGHPTWYLCEDGSALTYDSTKPFQHYCASEDKIYTGSSYDAAWRYYRHDELVRALKSLATAYSLSDELVYAKKAKDILLSYAEVYPNYPVQARGGRMYWQTLDEAVSMIDVSHAYDLIHDSGVLTNQEKANIELNFLKPSAHAISEYDMGRSNWQAWHIAAIGMIGFVLGDQELIDFAINSEHGFEYLMKESVLRDGFWWEGTIAYHMYALTPLNILAEGAKRWGHDLYANENLRKMFDVPLSYAYPNLTVPANNDGGQYGSTLIGPVSPKGFYEYEAAYSHYKKTEYAWLLKQKYGSNNIKREGDFALFKGVDEIPDVDTPKIESRNFDGVGHAILRSGGTSDQNYLLMDYGPHGGSHGHPDKLHIDLFGKGHLLAPDFGTPSYGHPAYLSWYKQTISHNTVVVNGASQKQSEGELDTFINSPNLKIISAQADQAYDGVEYKRTLILEDEYAIDWFTLSDSEKEHQYDYLLHGLGDFSTELPLEVRSEALGDKDGYQLLSNSKSTITEDAWEGSWSQGKAGLRIVSLPFGSREVVETYGPGPSNHPNQETPIVLQRQEGKEAQFVTVLQPTSEDSAKISASKTGEHQIAVNLENQTDHMYYRPDAETGSLSIGKVSTASDKSFDFSNSVSSEVINGVLNITVDSEAELQSLAMIVRASNVSMVKVNNIAVPFTQAGDQIVVELHAFTLIHRLPGAPEKGSISFKNDGTSYSLSLLGVRKSPMKLLLNGQSVPVVPSIDSDIVEIDLSGYSIRDINMLEWELAGKPYESVQVLLR